MDTVDHLYARQKISRLHSITPYMIMNVSDVKSNLVGISELFILKYRMATLVADEWRILWAQNSTETVHNVRTFQVDAYIRILPWCNKDGFGKNTLCKCKSLPTASVMRRNDCDAQTIKNIWSKTHKARFILLYWTLPLSTQQCAAGNVFCLKRMVEE